MANSSKSGMKTSELKKLIAREPDTVRAAHFRRVMDGTAPLEPLTCKTDVERVQRNALIDALPPINPVVDESAGPNESGLSGFAALQAQICDLQAQLSKQGD